MRDSIEVFVQPGERGFHAGVRGHSRVWAAHATDMETAAWRAALRRWFPKRANGVLTYQEAQSINIQELGDGAYACTLSLPDAAARKQEFARDFTPELPQLKAERRKPKTKRKK